jgi:hypothetical protein
MSLLTSSKPFAGDVPEYYAPSGAVLADTPMFVSRSRGPRQSFRVSIPAVTMGSFFDAVAKYHKLLDQSKTQAIIHRASGNGRYFSLDERRAVTSGAEPIIRKIPFASLAEVTAQPATSQLSLVDTLSSGLARQGKTGKVIDGTALLHSSYGGTERTVEPSSHPTSGSFVPLEPSEEEIDGVDADSVAVDVGLGGGLEMLSPYIAAWENSDEYNQRRSKHFHRLVSLHPHDATCWLAWIAFLWGQVETYNDVRRKRAKWVEIFQICEKALHSCAFSAQLLVSRMQALRRAREGEFDSVIVEWLRVFQTNAAATCNSMVILAFLEELRSDYTTFSVDSFTAYALWLFQRIQALREEEIHRLRASGSVIVDISAQSGSKLMEACDSAMLDVVSALADVRRAAGDASLNLVQQLAEFNFNMPSELRAASNDQQVAWFGSYMLARLSWKGKHGPDFKNITHAEDKWRGWIDEMSTGASAEEMSNAGLLRAQAVRPSRFSTTVQETVASSNSAWTEAALNLLQRAWNASSTSLSTPTMPVPWTSHPLLAEDQFADRQEVASFGFLARSEIDPTAQEPLPSPLLSSPGHDDATPGGAQFRMVYSAVHGYKIKVRINADEEDQAPVTGDSELYQRLLIESNNRAAMRAALSNASAKSRTMEPQLDRLSNGAFLTRFLREELYVRPFEGLERDYTLPLFTALLGPRSRLELAIRYLTTLGLRITGLEATSARADVVRKLRFWWADDFFGENQGDTSDFSLHSSIKNNPVGESALVQALFAMVHDFPSEALFQRALIFVFSQSSLPRAQQAMQSMLAIPEARGHIGLMLDVWASYPSQIKSVAALLLFVKTACNAAQVNPSSIHKLPPLCWNALLHLSVICTEVTQLGTAVSELAASFAAAMTAVLTPPTTKGGSAAMQLQQVIMTCCQAMSTGMEASLNHWLQRCKNAGTGDHPAFVWLNPTHENIHIHAEYTTLHAWNAPSIACLFMCWGYISAVESLAEPASRQTGVSQVFERSIGRAFHKACTFLATIIEPVVQADRVAGSVASVSDLPTCAIEVPKYDPKSYDSLAKSRVASSFSTGTLYAAAHPEKVDAGVFRSCVLGLGEEVDETEGLTRVQQGASWQHLARALHMHLGTNEDGPLADILQYCIRGLEWLCINYAHAATGLMKLAGVRPCVRRYAIHAGLSMFPNSEHLLRMAFFQSDRVEHAYRWISLEMDMLEQSLAPLCAFNDKLWRWREIKAAFRVRRVGQIAALGGPDGLAEGGMDESLVSADYDSCVHVLERHVRTDTGSRSVLAWRWLIRLHLLGGRAKLAYRTFFRAITSCPWSRCLWLDAPLRLQPYLEGTEISALLLDSAKSKGVQYRSIKLPDMYEIK